MRNTSRDDRLLTGRGQYVHDISLPGMLHAVFVRSVHARARLISVDLTPAKASEGVVAVLDASHFQGLTLPTINLLLADTHAPECPLLASGQVSSVGQPIAVVMAYSLQAAQDAAERVLVDYDALPAVADLQADAASVAYVTHRTGVALPAIHKVQVQHRQPRVVAMSLEPRAAVAQWHADSGLIGGSMTVWLPTQTPSRAQADIARALGLPPTQVRIVAPDVGGAFGAKSSVCPEDLVIAFAAKQLQTTVQWTSSRSDEFTSGTQGRGALLQGELSMDADGRFLHLQARMQFPLGAWLPFSAVVPARNAARILPGPYVLGSVDFEARASMSNAAAVNIYRGAGRPEAALLMERLVEKAARKSGIDPVELRLRNLIPASAMPFTTPTGEQLDAGDYRAALLKACARFDYAGERALQAARRATGELVGELVGIGIAMYIEPCGQGWESARVTLQVNGRVLVASGSASQGQGHDIAYATIAAEALGCDAALITVDEGDTATCPAGIGALASRSMAIGGSAVLQAAQIAAKRRDAGEPLPIVADTVYTAPFEAWSYGCVIARMSIDRDTGVPTVERIVWVDDAGRIISPALAYGQLMGGLAQGLGQAMMEQIVYNDDGQLITGSLMDYAVPRAADMPPVEIESMAVATTANLLGAKGLGEAGCIGVPAALLNAAADALAPLVAPGGSEFDLDFPLTSERLWLAIQALSG